MAYVGKYLPEGYDFSSEEEDDFDDEVVNAALASVKSVDGVATLFLRDAWQLRCRMLAEGMLPSMVDSIFWMFGVNGPRMGGGVIMDYPESVEDMSAVIDELSKRASENCGMDESRAGFFVKLSWDGNDDVKWPDGLSVQGTKPDMTAIYRLQMYLLDATRNAVAASVYDMVKNELSSIIDLDIRVDYSVDATQASDGYLSLGTPLVTAAAGGYQQLLRILYTLARKTHDGKKYRRLLARVAEFAEYDEEFRQAADLLAASGKPVR